MKSKKAQEEIVGFAAIVLIVSVIIIIFIGANLGNKGNERKSAILTDFLTGLSQVTTECAAIGSDYRDVADLARDCYNKKECSSGESACTVLNDTLSDIVESSLKYGEDYSKKGYIFLAAYSYSKNNEQIIKRLWGNCTGNYNRAEISFSETPGLIKMSMQECY